MTKKAVSNRRVIFTGGPGAGKTTLLTALAGRGYACAHDSSRAIIQDRLRRGLSARPDPTEFATATLSMDIERYRKVPTEADLVFFGRAIPDALCMLSDLGLLSLAEAGQSVLDFPYFRQVFVAPPWEEIYTTDNERDQRFAESVRVHRRARDQPIYGLVAVTSGFLLLYPISAVLRPNAVASRSSMT